MKYIFLLLLFSPAVFAEVVDLEISSNLNFKEVDFLHQGEFNVTIFNHGPDTAGDRPDIINPNTIGFSGQLINEDNFLDFSIRRNANIEQDCFFGLAIAEPPETGPQVATYIYFITYPTLLLGESVTCYGEYGIGFKSGTRAFSMRAFSIGSEVDPILDNNIIEFSFRIKPMIIPMLSWFSLSLLVFFMMLIAHVIFKNNRIKQ